MSGLEGAGWRLIAAGVIGGFAIWRLAVARQLWGALAVLMSLWGLLLTVGNWYDIRFNTLGLMSDAWGLRLSMLASLSLGVAAIFGVIQKDEPEEITPTTV